jgi:hypothetical protein
MTGHCNPSNWYCSVTIKRNVKVLEINYHEDKEVAFKFIYLHSVVCTIQNIVLTVNTTILTQLTKLNPYIGYMFV